MLFDGNRPGTRERERKKEKETNNVQLENRDGECSIQIVRGFHVIYNLLKAIYRAATRLVPRNNEKAIKYGTIFYAADEARRRPAITITPLCALYCYQTLRETRWKVAQEEEKCAEKDENASK